MEQNIFCRCADTTESTFVEDFSAFLHSLIITTVASNQRKAQTVH